MKLLNKYKLLLVVTSVFYSYNLLAQDSKPSLLIDVSYNQEKNAVQFVSVYTKAKIEKKFTAIPNITLSVFLQDSIPLNLIGTVTTDKSGRARIAIPVNLKNIWDSLSSFKLVATTAGSDKFEAASGEANITKAKIFIKTYVEDSVKSIEISVKEKKGSEWVPAADVETKVIIKRSVGDLSVGDAESYTTDSTGTVVAEFKKTNIPGDAGGNIVIVAKTEDNDQVGNISTEEKIKWGVPLVIKNTFDERTLFATRNKAPIWLMVLATGIVVSVWAVIFFLATQIIKIRKAGLTKATS